VLDRCLHQKNCTFKYFSNCNHFSSLVVAYNSLENFTSSDADVNGWLDKRFILKSKVLLELDQLLLDVQRRVHCSRTVIRVAEELHAPSRCHDQAALVGHHFGHTSLHAVALSLDDLHDCLQQNELLLLPIHGKRVLLKLDGHRQNCLLKVLSSVSSLLPEFQLCKVSETARDVRFELNLYILDLFLFDLLLAKVHVSLEADVGQRFGHEEEGLLG